MEVEVILNKPVPVYFPGEEVSGYFKIQCKERKKINSILLCYSGETYVEWTETSYGPPVRQKQAMFQNNRQKYGRRHNGRSKKVTHTNKQVFIKSDVILASKTDESDLYLECGEQNYPIKLVLPEKLPTSFEHETGFTRYSIKAHIDIPWAFDITKTVFFTVINLLDLNLIPGLRVPLSANEQKTVCCGSCQSDPIIGSITIPKSGYVCGEKLYFKVSIENKSKSKVNSIGVILVQTALFHAIGQSTTEKKYLATTRFTGEIKGKSTGNWDDGFILIPSVCPSTNDPTSAININYEIMFFFNTSAILSIGIYTTIPISIGTTPILSENNMHLATKTFSFVTSETTIDENQNEADNVDKKDTDNFKPLYPYFKNFST